MRIIGASLVESALDYRLLMERLRQAFRGGIASPAGERFVVPDVDGAPAMLSLIPAWQSGRHIGVRVATLFPDNARRDLPTGMGAYLLLSGRTGAPMALIDGPSLTARRTAATSALAAGYLARQDSQRLLMVGAGALAPYLIQAHAAVRPIANVLVWSRHARRAQRLARSLDRRAFRVAATEDLEAASRGADVICCATLAREPLVQGAWLQRGQHLDLVGAVTRDMRETDDAAVTTARVFVDTRDGATMDGGDIAQPLAAGVLRPDDIAGDLFDLTRGERAGRRFYSQVTLFKAVGSGLADLAAAQLVVQQV